MKDINKVFSIFLGTFLVYFGVFVLAFFSGLNNKPFQSEDYIGTAVLPLSIIHEGNLDLNEYYNTLIKSYPQPDHTEETPYYLKKAGDKYFSIRPITTALLALPVYLIPGLILDPATTDINILGILSHAGGAFITALSCAVFYLLCRKEVSDKKALFLTFIYAFATNSLSVSSQGLWQHGSSQLLIALGLYFIYQNRYSLSGLSFGLATIARPTNLLSLGIFGLFVLFKNKKEGIKFFMISGIPVIAEIVFNYFAYGNADNSGYGEQMTGWTANIFEGFFGLWISPSKGLLICSPFLIFILPVMYKKLTKFKLADLFSFMSLTVLLHTLAMGKWYSWYGGYSWGSRMSSDVLPLMILLLVPFINSQYFKNLKIRLAFFALILWSIMYHFLGIIYFDGIWHTVFDGKRPYWLWSIKDSEIIFTFKRILNKLGLIEDPIQDGLNRMKSI